MEDHFIRQNRRRETEKVPGKIKKIQARRHGAVSAGAQNTENRMVCPKTKEPD